MTKPPPKLSYSLMGAFLFRYLESPHELAVREKVSEDRELTLDKLWELTGETRSPQPGLQMICGRWSSARSLNFVSSERR